MLKDLLVSLLIALHLLSAPTVKPLNPKETAFSLEQAPKNSLRGEIATMSGSIYWQSRIATDPARITEEILLQQGETLIASDSGIISINFSGNILTLQPKTELEMVQTLPGHLVFNQKRGTVNYTMSGSVRSLHLLTNISSGSAIIAVDEQKGLVTVENNGEIQAAYNDKNFESQLFTLKPGGKYIYDDNIRLLRRL